MSIKYCLDLNIEIRGKRVIGHMIFDSHMISYFENTYKSFLKITKSRETNILMLGNLLISSSHNFFYFA